MRDITSTRALLPYWRQILPDDQSLPKAIESAIGGDLEKAQRLAEKALQRASGEYAVTMDKARVAALWRASSAAEAVLIATSREYDHDEYKAAHEAAIFGPDGVTQDEPDDDP